MIGRQGYRLTTTAPGANDAGVAVDGRVQLERGIISSLGDYQEDHAATQRGTSPPHGSGAPSPADNKNRATSQERREKEEDNEEVAKGNGGTEHGAAIGWTEPSSATVVRWSASAMRGQQGCAGSCTPFEIGRRQQRLDGWHQPRCEFSLVEKAVDARRSTFLTGLGAVRDHQDRQIH